MSTTILSEIRKYNGYEENTKVFDSEFLSYANGACMVLHQIGGLDGDLKTIKDTTTLSELPIQKDQSDKVIMSYINAFVKNLFDPSQNASINEANKAYIAQLEFRIQSEVDEDVKTK